MILAFIATLLISDAICLSTAPAAPPTAAAATIFILAGQSNMSGRGGVVNDTWDGVVPPACSPNSAIMMLGPNLRWELAVEPLHKDIDLHKTCGIGPGMAFASSIAGRGAIGKVGLVPCGRGGTRLEEWEKGSGSGLYEAAVRRGKAAERRGRIGGVVWYQGESDTLNETDASLYGRRLVKLFGDLRRDLELPLLPIFQVALASGAGPYKSRVRAAQLGMNLINVFTVDAEGLQLEPDNLHLTTPAQVRLGSMLASAYLNTMSLPSSAFFQLSSAGSQTCFSNCRFSFWSERLFGLVVLMTVSCFVIV
uniref:Sialate O-acetylesterase domain-containing protein n=1 Tax=Kalanchoe fedtschenkoi TaxID=63787 RepID=A0A7N0TR43_KALFE